MMAGLKGSITGAVFAMIGIAGQTVGTLINCSTKVGTLIKVGVTATSKVAGGISITMAGFDITAFVSGLFEPNNPITRLNQKLHLYDEYNYFQVGVTASAIFTGGMTRTMVCFVAGTPILTPSGLVEIENIKTGDKVVSTNAETFEIAEKNVIETYIRQTKKLVHLTINGELIQTTTEHPFYVKNHGFVTADELQTGDELLDLAGNLPLVEDATLEFCLPSITVYNFEVEDFHTYHVGYSCVLVHNDCGIGANKWHKGSRDTPEKSLLHHFEKHGLEVGATTIEQYLRKATAFAQNLRVARKAHISGATPGVIRYYKNGKYIDMVEGTIISFGKQ